MLSSQAVDRYRRDGYHKPHLLFAWLNELVRHQRILDAVGDILAPNLLCWNSRYAP
jgi:hypothetical protein